MGSTRQAARDTRRRCPLCHDGLPEGAAARACPECDTAYHVACLTELGGCATAGCAGRPTVTAVGAPRPEASDKAAPQASDLAVAGPAAALALALRAALALAVALAAGGAVAGGSLQAVIAWGEWLPRWLPVPLVVLGGLGGMATAGAVYVALERWLWPGAPGGALPDARPRPPAGQ